MSPPRFHSAAQAELRRGARWYEEQCRGLGQQLIDEVERTVREIAVAPGRWPLWNASRSERRALVDRFPYLVIYEHHDGEVFIKAVAHVRRRPAYWSRRSR